MSANDDSSGHQHLIYFFTSHPHHILMFKPIVRMLHQRIDGVRCLGISTAEFHHRSSDQRLLTEVFDSFWILPGWQFQSSLVRRWINEVDRILERVPGLPLFSRGLRYGYILVSRIFHIWRTNHRLRKILNDPMSRVIILSNDRAFPVRHAAPTARLFGIKSLLVQESIRKDEVFKLGRPGRLRLPALDAGHHGQGESDRVAAWGETSKRYFIRIGVEPERIDLTGNPRIDDFHEEVIRLSTNELRLKIGLPRDARVVLFATNPLHHIGILSEEAYSRSVESVLETIPTLTDDIHLVVKAHQNEYSSSVTWLESKLLDHPRIRHDPEMTLPEAIVASNAVLVFNSTVALEAALANRDVGVLKLYDVDYGVNFDEYDLAVPLLGQQDVIDFLSGNYPAKWAFMRKDVGQFITNLGRASESITDCIVDLGSLE